MFGNSKKCNYVRKNLCRKNTGRRLRNHRFQEARVSLCFLKKSNNKNMKSVIAFLVLTGAFINVHAQNYMITFAGTGASSTIDSVKVENLSQCSSLTFAGTDILNLTSIIVGINEVGIPAEGFVNVYPNPSSGNFSIEFETVSDENFRIELYDILGNTVLQNNAIINAGHHTFYLRGILAGLYLLKIESVHYKYTTKLVSLATKADAPEIKNTGQENNTETRKAIVKNSVIGKSGGNKSVIGMQFNDGDTLKITGKSGIYRTVCMLFPTQSQTLTFNFVKCTDADSNNYAVVQIGTQLWMEENLKTTHYRDGSAIPNVADSAAWGTLTSGAYCNYHNDTDEGDYYGRLYNFYAVADARNICPVGWHVASNMEWNIMEKFLDPTVDTTAWMGRGKIIGRILKEGCNTRWLYLDTTSGWNCVGFTALCTNFRNNTGAWSLAPNNDHDDAFWTSTSYNTTTAWGLSLRWCFGDIYAIPLINKRSGSSVRCIKN